MKTITIIILCLFSIFVKAQDKTKDTLFFSYDKNYIRTYVEIPNHYFIKDGSGSNNGNFYFTEIKILKNQNVKHKELCLKKFIHSSKFYDKNRQVKLNDYGLWQYFNNYTIILVKKTSDKKQCIVVDSSYIIE